MTEQEAQALVDGWLKAQLDRDRDVRRSDDPGRIAAHEADDDLVGGLWRKQQNDHSVAARHVEELIATHGFTVSDAEKDMMTRFMVRAHVELTKAVWARSAKEWRPWLEDDPAKLLTAKLVQDDGHSPLLPPRSHKRFGRLSNVAKEAVLDLSRTGGWSPNRVTDYEKAIELFTFALGHDPDLGEVSRELAAGYMRDLTRYPSNANKREPYRAMPTFKERIAAATAAADPKVMDAVTINGKYLTPLRKVWAWRQVSHPELANPFQDLSATTPRKGSPDDERRPFSRGEVIRLLALPMFTGAKGRSHTGLYQPGPVKIDDWRVWVPLIALFSGMRLNEACGLGVSDVKRNDDVPFFHIRDDIEGQRLKSDAAYRIVPVHDSLVDVGFLHFVERQRQAGRVRLFEELEPNSRGYFSGEPSKFFRRVLKLVADKEPAFPGKLVFHSTRHTVISKLRSAGVRMDVSKQIVGHEQGETHGDYGDCELPALREAINKIEYPGLDLAPVRRP